MIFNHLVLYFSTVMNFLVQCVFSTFLTKSEKNWTNLLISSVFSFLELPLNLKSKSQVQILVFRVFVDKYIWDDWWKKCEQEQCPTIHLLTLYFAVLLTASTGANPEPLLCLSLYIYTYISIYKKTGDSQHTPLV